MYKRQAYNQLLLRHLEQLVHAETRPCSVIVCGRWGRDVLAGTDLPVREICAEQSDTPTMAEALDITETLKNLYRTGEADEIHLVYQRFDSVLHQTPVHRQLLPAAPEADAPAANNNYLFVPDAQTVLDNVLELYPVSYTHLASFRSASRPRATARSRPCRRSTSPPTT